MVIGAFKPVFCRHYYPSMQCVSPLGGWLLYAGCWCLFCQVRYRYVGTPHRGKTREAFPDPRDIATRCYSGHQTSHRGKSLLAIYFANIRSLTRYQVTVVIPVMILSQLFPFLFVTRFMSILFQFLLGALLRGCTTFSWTSLLP